MVWYSHLLKNFAQFIVIHTVKGFGIVKKKEIDVFLELSCFFHDPADVGNLISGSSAFSKTSLNIRKFTFHILLKPGLENFEHANAGDAGLRRSPGEGNGNPLQYSTSASSKTSLNIWKFMVQVLLKPGLENFEHYFTSM